MNASLFKPLCICICMIATKFKDVASFSVTVLEPIKESPTQAGLIVIAGAYIGGDRYKPLGVAIQKTSPHKLWVGLVNMFLYGNITGAVSDATRMFQEKGMQPSAAIFVAGHQMGGAYLNMLIQEGKIRPTGQILMAAYKWVDISPEHGVKQPPTLIVSGDLDGLNRITRMSDFFEDLMAAVEKDSNAVYSDPVITLQGVNNGQFASAPLPNTVTDYDITAEVDNATAHAMIAKYCASFMVSVMQLPAAAFVEARANLLEGFEENISRMQPLISMKKQDVDDGSSSWTKYAQFVVSGFPQESKDALIISNSVVPPIILNKTWANVSRLHDDGFYLISTYTTVDRDGPPNFESVNPITTLQLEARMKSRAAIQDAFGVGTDIVSHVKELQCKDINQLAFQLALNSSSAIAQSRYAKRGRAIQFNEDSITADNERWTFSSIQLGYTMGNSTPGLIVTSPVLETPLDYSPNYAAGMKFCKLLSPLRAIEWIYIDSLKYRKN